MVCFDDVKHWQDFFLSLGKNGCYLLQLIYVAEKHKAPNEYKRDILEYIVDAVNSIYVVFDRYDCKDSDNFTVVDPAGLLQMFTGYKWQVRKHGADYKAQPGECVIKFYAKSQQDADRGIGHFDSDGWHSLQDSQTVKYGKVYSTRVCKIIGEE